MSSLIKMVWLVLATATGSGEQALTVTSILVSSCCCFYSGHLVTWWCHDWWRISRCLWRHRHRPAVELVVGVCYRQNCRNWFQHKRAVAYACFTSSALQSITFSPIRTDFWIFFCQVIFNNPLTEACSHVIADDGLLAVKSEQIVKMLHNSHSS